MYTQTRDECEGVGGGIKNPTKNPLHAEWNSRNIFTRAQGSTEQEKGYVELFELSGETSMQQCHKLNTNFSRKLSKCSSAAGALRCEVANTAFSKLSPPPDF